MRCQACGGKGDGDDRICSFCGSSLTLAQDSPKSKILKQEPCSEISGVGAAKTLIDSGKAVKDLFSGSPMDLLSDVGNILNDVQDLTNKQNVGTGYSICLPLTF